MFNQFYRFNAAIHIKANVYFNFRKTIIKLDNRNLKQIRHHGLNFQLYKTHAGNSQNNIEGRISRNIRKVNQKFRKFNGNMR